MRHAFRYFHRVLWAYLALAFVVPAYAQRVKILEPKDEFVSIQDKIFVSARGLPKFPVTLWLNGDKIETLPIRPDRQVEFFNVSAVAGPNNIKVVQTLRNGRSFADSISIHVIGRAASIDLKINPSSLPADGESEALVTTRALDQWGQPLPDGYLMSLSLRNGTVTTEDIYKDQPGVQVQVKNGEATAVIVSPEKVGSGRLEVMVDQVVVESEIAYTQPFIPWTLTGNALGQVGWRTGKVEPGDFTSGPIHRAGGYGEGKIALFGQGSIGSKFLLTTSFDSDRNFDRQVFRFVSPEKFFPIHGDASSIFYESPSAGRFYAKITTGYSTVQYGDFSTDLSRNELLSYNRSFTGFSSDIKTARSEIQLFAASTDQAIQVDQIPGEGVSGAYYLSAARSNVPIVEGSERVVLQTRDRIHKENVLDERPQNRFTDYTIDYDRGTLLFKRPVPYRTFEENPVFIVVTYETARALEHHKVAGGRVGFDPHEKITIGGTIVGEQRSEDNFWLTGVDAELRPLKELTLTSEIARTTQHLEESSSRDGWAWRIGANGDLADRIGYSFYYQEADTTFVNPNSVNARPGVSKIRGQINLSPIRSMSIQTELFREENERESEVRVSSLVTASYRYRSFENQFKLENTETDKLGDKTGNTIVTMGTEWEVRRWLGLGFFRDQTFGQNDISYKPTLNKITSRLGLNDRFDLVGEHSFRDGSFADSSYTTVGLQSRLAGDLNAFANYEIGGLNDYRNQAIIGLRHKYSPFNDLTLNMGVERVKTLRGKRDNDFTAFNIASEYLPPEDVKASGRIEFRRGVTANKIVGNGAVDFSLKRGLSLLAKHTFLGARTSGTNGVAIQNSHHFQSGLAYRPTTTDRVNILGKYELKSDHNNSASSNLSTSTHIGSIETIIEPRSQVELFFRYGFKVNYLEDEGNRTRSLTDLWMANVRYEWYRSFDILVEYRLLFQRMANDFVNGSSFEIGTIPMKNVRLAAGYNLAGFEDRDFSGNNYWAHGPFIKLQLKFTERTVAGAIDGLQNLVK